MSSMFIKVLNLSINASWLILAILLLRPLLRKAPKWIRCAMWAIVALRLLLPFSIESTLSVLPGSEVIPQDIVTTKTPAIHSQIMAVDNAINPFMLRELAPKVENSVNPMQVIAAVVSVVWIVGVGVCLIYALISYLLLKRKVSASVAMGDGIMACDEIKTPFILGIIKPMIYMPSSMTGRTLEVVLAHEKAHLKRMDHLWKPLGFLLFSVYWFNPLCLIAYIFLCRDIEAACDEKVIRNRDKKFAADYSQALLDLSLPRRMITVCPLAFGETGVKGRVRGVLNYRKPAFWVTLIALVMCVVVSIYFMTSPVTRISKDAERVKSIKVFDGTCGKELIITDRGEIETIVSYVNEMKLHRGKVSLGYMGYHFHLTFQPKRGTWDDFIISSSSIRNDPFFYSLETESGLEDYIEDLYVSHGVKEPSNTDLALYSRNLYPNLMKEWSVKTLSPDRSKYLYGKSENQDGKTVLTIGVIDAYEYHRPTEFRLNTETSNEIVKVCWLSDALVGAETHVNPSTGEFFVYDLETGQEVKHYIGSSFAVISGTSHVMYEENMPHFSNEDVCHSFFIDDQKVYTSDWLNARLGKPTFSKDLTKVSFLEQRYDLDVSREVTCDFDLQTLTLSNIRISIPTQAKDMDASSFSMASWEYDLDRNGIPESPRLVTFDEGLGQRFELWEDGKMIWSEEGYSVHAGYNALFLCVLNGDAYLLRYHPTMYQGAGTYSYQLFSIENGTEKVVQENSVNFVTNFYKGKPLYGEFNPEIIAAFMDEINNLLSHSTQLLNTDGELLETFAGKTVAPQDTLGWLDMFDRDSSKSLLENLQAFQLAQQGENIAQ